jgi:transcriptional regulator with XRE-family HTH domain
MPERVVRRFGEKLRDLRTKRNVSTRALAAAINVSNGSITEVESGRTQPGIDFAYKVASYFGVSADDLLDDEREVG